MSDGLITASLSDGRGCGVIGEASRNCTQIASISFNVVSTDSSIGDGRMSRGAESALLDGDVGMSSESSWNLRIILNFTPDN